MEALQNLYSTFGIWLGIVLCLSQSAVFSGLNLAFFSVSRLRLEVEVANGNVAAEKVLKLRRDSNFLLATVLWGNVGINVLLTLLSNSVMFGVTAFLFSTFLITIGGEILPQAYFSRNALRMAAALSPLLRFYQIVLFPIAKPTGMLLDLWLGKEGIQYLREKELYQLIHKHIEAAGSDVDAVEGIGALNFLALDDVPVCQEGEILVPGSILTLSMDEGVPVLSKDQDSAQEMQQHFMRQIAEAECQWIVITDNRQQPVWVLNADAYLRQAFLKPDQLIELASFCHKPILVTDPETRLGTVISRFKPKEAQSDKPLPEDVILLWSNEKRIITGSDILGRLFQGIGVYSAIDYTGRRNNAK